MEKLFERPIFFERNRVFRIYKGGLLFHDFFGDEAKDGNYPEEWVASSVRAMNLDSTNEKEGISKIKGTELYLDEALEKYPREILGDCPKWDVLVKLLDSGIRLPMQCHPDREFAKGISTASTERRKCGSLLQPGKTRSCFWALIKR